MKCEVCGFEVHGEAPHHAGGFTSNRGEAFGLTVGTNGPTPPEAFAVVFGFWDQRAQRRVDFCGACLVERLLQAPPVVARPMNIEEALAECGKWRMTDAEAEDLLR